MRISDWSSDVCSSDLLLFHFHLHGRSSALACGPSGQGLIDGADVRERPRRRRTCVAGRSGSAIDADPLPGAGRAAGSGEGGMTQADRSEEHTSELQSLMRSSYAVLCLKKKNQKTKKHKTIP